MLVLSRKQNQEIHIGDQVKITVLKVKGNTVRLGIEAPRSVRVVRGELPKQEPQPEPTMAEVTVVFTDSKDKPVDDDSMSIVPFQRKAKSSQRLEPQSNVETVTSREPLPEQIHPNRLREILAELSGQ